MNKSIVNIGNALDTIHAEIANLVKECPSMKSSWWQIDLKEASTHEVMKKLEIDLNRFRLQKIALDKLTPQDIEILGIKNFIFLPKK